MRAKNKSKLREWQNKYIGAEGECIRCKRIRDVSVDHIIPVHILESIGLVDEAMNDEENFELICSMCNKFKAGRIDMANPKTIPLLKKYINKLE